MAKAKKNYSITKAKNTPHYELKIGDEITVPKDRKREKYLFSSKQKAQNFIDSIISPAPKAAK